jgi:uncharacterized protein (TIGR02117 family)
VAQRQLLWELPALTSCCPGMMPAMSREPLRRSAFALACALALPLAMLGLYLGAAVIGAVVPRNAAWQEPDAGVLIWVRSNGVHADLVLPARAEGIDWYEALPPEHVVDPRLAAGWIGIGWGQREFYLETPTWGDLTLRTAVGALAGGSALMHVTHLSRPRADRWYRPVRITPHGYRRLAEGVLAAFDRDAQGRPVPLPGTGYGAYDTFYEARGTYHAFRTSNVWTGDMLAAAGVRIGVWTPFEQSILWRFPVGEQPLAR